MSAVLHLIVGPDEHGVVRHGTDVAEACGHRWMRLAEVGGVLETDLHGVDVVHLPFTDRLFGSTCEDAATAVTELAARITAAGAVLSVTLHDVPAGNDALSERRRTAYIRVMAAARGVVVNSRTELAAVQDNAQRVHSLRHIDLPVETGSPVGPLDGRGPAGTDVAVLGFVFPDRGYEGLLRALPAGVRLVALGRAAAGHEDLPGRLAKLAEDADRGWTLTGFLPDAELVERLRTAGVPVAPNERVTASASIATWLTHGRRPLVPDIPYTRELDARMPGALTRYDPTRPGDLAAAIERALADPASTWLSDDVRLGPSQEEVSRQYRAHLHSCVPPAELPGNRWDLICTTPPARPQISVIVPYYDAQRSLDLVLTGLRHQTTAERIEVIVADDGSPTAPDVSAAGGLVVRVIRQERLGFGAARARNLGASVATGDVLAFVDADMVPLPDYLEHLTRLPAAHPDALTVGRRRHADFDGWGSEDVASWCAGHRAGPPELVEPEWLRSAYRETADLLHADARSYRFVISAVLGMTRSLFERIGGFDERFDHYGGEDWELANRAWLAGALFAHVPAAVAWHDGVDWGARAQGDGRTDKNPETLALCARLPDPALRGPGQWFPYTYALVTMPGNDPVGVLATMRTAFAAGADCQFQLTGPSAAATAAVLADPRVSALSPPGDVRARAVVTVAVSAPCDLRDLPQLCVLAANLGVVVTPAVTLVSTRAMRRCVGLGPEPDAPDVPDVLASVAQLFGRHDRAAPIPWASVDLAAVLGSIEAP